MSNYEPISIFDLTASTNVVTIEIVAVKFSD